MTAREHGARRPAGRRSTLVVLAGLVSGLMLGTTGCRSQAEREGRWAQRGLLQAVRRVSGRSDNGILDLRDQMQFDWDRLIVLPPYSSEQAVTQKLGFRWNELKKSASQLHERFVVMVFVKDQRVAAWLDLARDSIDFEPLVDRGYIPRDAAIFTAVRSRGRKVQIHPRGSGS